VLISRGNLKLGILPSFSLPPMKTCPGKTPFCDKYCFGCHGNYILANTHSSNELRLEVSRTSDFVPRMVADIRRIMAPAFRLHVVGDFYSAEYLEKWIEIVRRFPDIHFFGSTRSWRVPKIAKTLEEFRDEKNVYMRASVDLTDHLSPAPAWSTWSVEGQGVPCPHDKGKVKSCYTCGRCWNDKTINTSFELRWGKAGEYTSVMPGLI
jgi:hypothetical protein